MTNHYDLLNEKRVCFIKRINNIHKIKMFDISNETRIFDHLRIQINKNNENRRND